MDPTNLQSRLDSIFHIGGSPTHHAEQPRTFLRTPLNSVHRIESEAAAATQDPMGFAQHPHWIGHVTEYYTATEDRGTCRLEKADQRRPQREIAQGCNFDGEPPVEPFSPRSPWPLGPKRDGIASRCFRPSRTRVPGLASVFPESRRSDSPLLDSRTGADSSALLPPRPSGMLPCPSTKAGRRGSEEAVAQLRYLVGPFLSLGKLDCLHHPRVASFQP